MKAEGRLKNWGSVWAALFLIIFLTLFFAVAVGPAHIRLQTVLKVLASKVPFVSAHPVLAGEKSAETIILLLRVPRAVQAALVGASLAVSGVVIQSLFRNPMADPFVVGISSGASLGAAAAILLGLGGGYALPLLAFIGAAAAAFVVYRIAKTGSSIAIETLLLSGIAVAYFFSSIT